MGKTVRVFYTIENNEYVYRFERVWHSDLMEFVAKYLKVSITRLTPTIRLSESQFYEIKSLLSTLGYKFETTRTAKSNYRKGE